jgi:hypothetical protein
MQHAVHNRATIRVADRTDVSGRVTADEVNLDRFHNRIGKVCALVAATLIPSSLRWMLLCAVLIVPQVLWGGRKRARHATAHTGKDVARDRGSSE